MSQSSSLPELVKASDLVVFERLQQERLEKVRSLDHKTLDFMIKELEGLIHVSNCFLNDAKKYNPDAIQYIEGEIGAYTGLIKNIESFKEGFT